MVPFCPIDFSQPGSLQRFCNFSPIFLLVFLSTKATVLIYRSTGILSEDLSEDLTEDKVPALATHIEYNIN
jgi:hypothetical protein